MTNDDISKLEERLEKVDKDFMDRLIQEVYVRDPENFILVKIGANDGWMCDDLYDFVMKNDPKCIMVEPIPDYFDILKKNFSTLKNVAYEQVAIDTKSGYREMTYIPDAKFQAEQVDFRLRHQPHLLKEHWARGLGSFYKDKNNLACPELAQHVETLDVATITMDQLFEKYKITKDRNIVVVTDCEGHDYEILKTFDFAKYNPSIYICEIELLTRYPNSHPRRQPYIDSQRHPDARPPPDTGWKLGISVLPHQRAHFDSLQSQEDQKEYLEYLMATGRATGERAWDGPPEDMEYLQENGLYTAEEFKSTVDIFELSGYVVLRQLGGDMVAVNPKLLKTRLGLYVSKISLSLAPEQTDRKTTRERRKTTRERIGLDEIKKSLSMPPSQIK